jgi:hypothetical protein
MSTLKKVIQKNQKTKPITLILSDQGFGKPDALSFEVLPLCVGRGEEGRGLV